MGFDLPSKFNSGSQSAKLFFKKKIFVFIFSVYLGGFLFSQYACAHNQRIVVNKQCDFQSSVKTHRPTVCSMLPRSRQFYGA